MASDRLERRLAAILVADMVGFSRLMGADEAGTIARQAVHRREVFDPAIADHHGRTVKTTGDGLLVEFASVVDAVGCAATIQRSIAAREADMPPDRRIRYRIGVNLGDIVVDGDDILGDGVNVAARLEGLAEPGGICIPHKVLSEVRDKLDLGFEFVGDRTVKNIAMSIPVYRVLLAPDAAGRVIGERGLRRRTQRLVAVATGGLVTVALAGAAVWWQSADPAVVRATLEQEAVPKPERPSIMVLPFQNMSDDSKQDYFADGIAEDIITGLSKLSALFVVARNTSFQYKGRAVDMKEVGRQIGVRFILEGSVRRAGDQVRISARLIDSATGGHLWAERYDGRLADTFALQDQVTGRVVEALALKLGSEEKARLADHGTTSFEAYDALLKGQSYARQYTSEGFAQAIREFERALELDPGYTRAATAIANVRYIHERSGLQ